MRLKQQVRDFRKTLGGAVNLALIPVRLPVAAACFFLQTISHWWNERQESKHGRVVNVGPIPDSGSWLPNGQQH